MSNTQSEIEPAGRTQPPGDRRWLLEAATRIGDELLELAERDEHGTFWYTLSYNGKDAARTLVWHQDEDVYSGVSGIVLFLMELFRQTGDGRYLDAARSGMDWVWHRCQHHEPENFGLLTGRLGTALALLRLYGLTGDPEHLARARLLARVPPEYLRTVRVDDLINGAAGTMLGLAHAFDVLREPWLLEAMDALCQGLLARAEHGPVGVYWSRSGQTIHGELGFAHGAGGVGFAFLELGRYFGNPALLWLAEQAFAYEDCRFDPDMDNWPDLRCMFFSEEELARQKALYRAGDRDHFRRATDFNAWCYGAAGIGLARLRALELTGHPAEEEAVHRALRKTIAHEDRFGRHQTMYADPVAAGPELVVPLSETRRKRYASSTLCHGLGGNAELFVEAYRHWGDEALLRRAEDVAARALANRDEAGMFEPGYSEDVGREDTGLFRGNAGIGYFFLRVYDPHGVPSVQVPSLAAAYDGPPLPGWLECLSLSRPALERRLLGRVFGRTLAQLQSSCPDALDGYFQAAADSADPRASCKRGFALWLEAALPGLPADARERVEDIWGLESLRAAMDEEVESNALLHIAHRVRYDRAQELVARPDDEIRDLELEIVPGVCIHDTRWRWCAPGEAAPLPLHAAPESHAVLLKPGAMGVLEVPLTPFGRAVIERFRGSSTIARAVDDLLGDFGPLTTEQEVEVRRAIGAQVREGLTFGVLAECAAPA